MIGRRELLHRMAVLSSAVMASTMLYPGAAIPQDSDPRALPRVKRLLLVHGRGQQGRDPDTLKAEWIATLRRGAAGLGRAIPADVDVSFPFYGDTLDAFATAASIPLTSEIRTRGGPLQDEFLVFQAAVAESLRTAAGVTDAQIDAEYGANVRPRGPLNWEWVQAILRALDNHVSGVSGAAIEQFTRDVFLYSTLAGVRDEIDRIVGSSLTEEPTAVIGHSLGSVVAYSVLRSDRRALRIPLFVTVGSPLGIRPVRDQFRPLGHPRGVTRWYNAYDPRDVVALYPLDGTSFPITPAVENHGAVRNGTDNHHGIVAYLDDPLVAARILDVLGG